MSAPVLIPITDATRRAMPGIRSHYRRKADDLIPHVGWIVWLEDGWLTEHAGRGPTLRAAYADALRRTPTLMQEAA